MDWEVGIFKGYTETSNCQKQLCKNNVQCDKGPSCSATENYFIPTSKKFFTPFVSWAF